MMIWACLMVKSRGFLSFLPANIGFIMIFSFLTFKTEAQNLDVTPVFNRVASNPFSVSRQDLTPRGFTLSDDGKKMFVAGTQGDNIIQYALGTAFDVTTAKYDEKFLNVSGQDNNPWDVLFSADGKKMYVLGRDGVDINEYSLTTAFDLTGASFVKIALSLSSQDNSPVAFEFSSDGSKLFVLGASDRDINQYSLNAAYDISTASFEKASASLISQESDVSGLTFSEDGTKLFIVGGSDEINEYTLSTPFDVGSLSFGGAPGNPFDISGQEGMPEDIAFSKDGLNLLMLGNDGNDIHQYALSRAFDIATASYISKSGNPFSVKDQLSFPTSVTFSKDGKKMYIPSINKAAIFQYSLTTAFDILTALYDNKMFSTSPQGAVNSVTFSSNGLKMFITAGSLVLQYSLTVAFDVSTATYDGVNLGTINGGAQESFPSAISFSNDGKKMFVVGSGKDRVIQYNLPTAYDLTGGSVATFYSVSSQETVPSGLAFSEDGKRMFIVGSSNDFIHQYELTEAFSLSDGVTYQNKRFSVFSQANTPRGIFFSSSDEDALDGIKMFITDNSHGYVVEYTLDKVNPTFTSGASVNFSENSTEAAYSATANERVVFSLGASKDESLFEISDAEIRFKSAPDFENPGDQDSDNTYIIDVIATDDGGNTATIGVTISVTDIDEVGPTITSGSSASIAENSIVTVYMATANETSTFSLGTSKDESFFSIDNGTEVSFKAAPDFESPQDENGDNVYLIDVIATDVVGNSSSKQVSVTVSDVDEIPPSFTSANSVLFSENGSDIAYTVTTDETSKLSLGSTKDESLFELSKTDISFQTAPDFESPQDADKDNIYQLDIIATDAAGNTTTFALAITVTDVDETSDTDPDPADPVNSTPTVENELSDLTLTEGFGSKDIDLSNVFGDEDGDELTYSSSSSDESITTLAISDNLLILREISLGTTTISVTASDGKGGVVEDSFEFTVVAEEVLSLENQLDRFRVYPNPLVENSLYIDLLKGVGQVSILNLEGQLLRAYKITGSSVQLDLKDFDSGIYLIRVQYEEGNSEAVRIIRR